MDALGVYSGLSFPQIGIITLVFSGVATTGSGSVSTTIDIDVDWDIATVNLSQGEYSWPQGCVLYMLPSTGTFDIGIGGQTPAVTISATAIKVREWTNRATIACNLFKLMH